MDANVGELKIWLMKHYPDSDLNRGIFLIALEKLKELRERNDSSDSRVYLEAALENLICR